MPGIIVGTDGSAHSRKAIEWAVREAGLKKAPLTVLTVQPAVVSFFGIKLAYPGDDELMKRAGRTALAELGEVLDQVAGDAHPASVAVRAVFGAPAEELLKAAADADLIVVGSRGTRGFKSLLPGSVSSQVVTHGHCPVVVVRS